MQYPGKQRECARLVAAALGVALGMPAPLASAGLLADSVGSFKVAADLSRRSSQEGAVKQAAAILTTVIASTPDTDGDPFPEAPPFVTGSGPAGGGLVPITNGIPQGDGHGARLGYCAWNNGAANGASANLLAGSTNNMGAPTFAVVSSGLDNIFNRSCAEIFAGTNVTNDDFVVPMSTAQIRQGVGGTVYFSDPVADMAALLALTGAKDGELRLNKENNTLWRWNTSGPAAGTWTSASNTYTASNVDITGGQINGTQIGNVTPSTGAFTTLTTPSATISGGTIDGTAIGATVASTGVFTTLAATGAFSAAGNGTFGGNVTAASFTGSGAALTNLNGSAINSGVVGTAFGGTGVNASAAPAGSLLIGTGGGFTLGALAAGAGIGITTGPGSILVANTGVTSFNTRTGAVVLTRMDVNDATAFGTQNTAIGNSALPTSSSGSFNTAYGFSSMASITTGGANTAVGVNTMRLNTTGSFNAAFGDRSLDVNTSGGLNAGFGRYTLGFNTTGSSNAALGHTAGGDAANNTANTTGSNNTFLGAYTGIATGFQPNFATVIGSGALVSTSNTIVLGRTTDNTVIGAVGDDASGYKLQVTGGIKALSGGLRVAGGDLVLNSPTIIGLLSARPTAAVAGRIYLATDTNQLYRDDGTTWNALSAGNVALSSLTAATANNTINNGANAQAWNWQLTGNTTAFNIAENVASTGGSGTQYLMNIGTLATSTAIPFRVATRGTEAFRVDSVNPQIVANAGTVAAPAYSFNGSQNTGLYSPAAGQLAASVGGSRGFVLTGSASGNAGFGSNSLFSLTTGTYNSAFGANAVSTLTTGNLNTSIGRQSMQKANGDNNTALGYFAGGTNINLITGSDSTFIGTNAVISDTAAMAGSGRITLLGANATASGLGGSVASAYMTAIGSSANVTTVNTVVLGRAASDVTVIGATGDDLSGNRLQVTGGVKATGNLTVGGTGTFTGAVTAPTFTGTFISDDATSTNGARPAKGVYVWTDKTFGMELQNQNTTWNTTFLTRAGDGGFNFKKSDGTQLLYIGNNGNSSLTGNVALNNGKGLMLAGPTDLNWGIYRALPGAGNSLSGGVAAAPLSGGAAAQMRFRGASTAGEGFTWENQAEQALMSLTGNTGDLYTRGNVNVGGNINMTGDFEVTPGRYVRFGHANQTDGNDGKIGAGLFTTGLNIIGTQTSPGTGREVAVFGNLRTVNSSITSTLPGSGTAMALQTNGGSGSYVDLQAATYYGYTNGAPATIRFIDDTIASNHITFRTKISNAFANADVERMRIASNGNVLIGTTTDNGNKLQVSGNASATGNLAIGGTGTFTGAVTAASFNGNGSGMTNLNGSNINSGTVGVAYGGTGLNGSAAANGSLLIGNGTGYTLANLTAGTGVSVTNGAGSITIANTGVTSFNARTGAVTLAKGDVDGVISFGTANTTLGTSSLSTASTGVGLTAFGNSALNANTSGNYSTAFGFVALQSNTTGIGNVGLGSGTLGGNTTGSANIAIGRDAGSQTSGGVATNRNISGSNNVFLGAFAMPGTTTQLNYASVIGSDATVTTSNTVVLGRATDNTVIGATGDDASGNKLQVTGGIKGTGNLTIGGAGTFTGAVTARRLSLADSTGGVGSPNVVIGSGAMLGAASGTGGNVALGTNTLAANTSGNVNVAIGKDALQANTTGNFNNALGQGTLITNTIGLGNTAIGNSALSVNSSGNDNQAVGRQALFGNTTGSLNTALGKYAGAADSAASTTNANTTGSNNTFLGASAMPGTTTQLNYATALGSDARVNTSNTIVLGRTSDNTVIGASADDASGNKLQVTGGIKGTGNLTIGGSGTFTGTVSASALTTTGDITPGGKIVVMNSQDGGSSKGIYMWNAADSAWGMYMGTAGAGKSLSGGTAVASLDGRTSHAIRSRVFGGNNNSFIWENSSEQALMSLTADSGNLLTRGSFNSGGSGTFSGALSASSLSTTGNITPGGRLGVMEGQDGGGARGIYMFSVSNSDWGTYMSTAGAGKSLSGGTAVTSLDGRGAASIRNRIANGNTTAFIWENSVDQALMSLTGDSGALFTKGGLTTGGNIIPGGKLGVMEGQDGGNGRGIYMFSVSNSDWGTYMSTAGAGKSLSGGTAVTSLDGRGAASIRNRIANGNTTAFIWENSVDQALMSLTGDSGTLYTKGGINAGGAVTGTSFSGNGSGMTNLNGSNINSGTVGVAYGGTGLNGSAAANGSLLIGNGTGYTLANITGTANQVNVTNGAGTIALSLPQNIAATSTPTFAGQTLTGSLTGTTATFSANLTTGGNLSVAGSVTSNLDVNSGNFARFGHANQTDGNDGKIGAGLFNAGLNIVGTQTVAAAGRSIYMYGNTTVEGTLRSIFGAPGGTGLRLINTWSGGGAYVDLEAGTYGQNYTNGAPATIRFIDAGNASNDITFRTKNPGGTANADAERMRLTSTGNLIIGTTADNGNKLQVSGNASATGNLAIGGTGTFTGAVTTNDSFNLGTSGTGTTPASQIYFGAVSEGTDTIALGRFNTSANNSILQLTLADDASNGVGAGGDRFQIVTGSSSGGRNGPYTVQHTLDSNGNAFHAGNLSITGTGTFSGAVTAPSFNGNGSGMTNLNGSNINSGTVGVAYGGTGLNGSAAANGSLLIGNGTGYTLANITGTANQVNVANGAGTIALSLPQNIAAASTPTFAGQTLTGNLSGTTASFTGDVSMTNNKLVFNDVLGDKIQMWGGYGFGIQNLSLAAYIPNTANFSIRNGGTSTGTPVFAVDSVGTTSIGNNLLLNNKKGVIFNGTDTNWGIYRALPGATNSLSGGTAVAPFSGGAQAQLRFRAAGNVNEGFVWENAMEQAMMSLTSDTGTLYTRGGINTGNNIAILRAAGPAQLSIGRAAAEVTLGVANTAGQYSTNAAVGDVVLRTETATQKLILQNDAFGAGMTLNGNKLGIGTTGPAQALDVVGNGIFSGTVTATSFNGNGSGMTNLNGSNINSGTVGVAYGGTGVNGSAAANGSLLIGNGTGYTLAGLTGTTNQVNVANSAGGITLSLPQNIATTSTPTFAGQTLTGGLTGTSATFSGNTSVGGQILAAGGTVAAPGISFTAQPSTGFYLPVANVLAASVGANRSMYLSAGSAAFGFNALPVDSAPSNYNAAFGDRSLNANTTGVHNTGIGSLALAANTTGSSNTAVGRSALASSTTGQLNVAVGLGAGNTTTNPFIAGTSTFIGSNATIADTAAMANSGRITLLGSDATASGLAAANNFAYMTAIGSAANVTTANTVVLGRAADVTVIGATGDDASGNKLQVTGGIKSTGNLTVGGTGTFSAALNVIGGGIRSRGASAVSVDGAYLQWNRDTVGGITYLMNQRGLGTGGISFGEITAANVYTQNMFLSPAGALTVTGAVTAASFSGDGSSMTNINANNISTGTLAVARGGTGLGTTPTNGQLLIGNGTGYTLASLTAGAGVTITPGAGSITIANSGVISFNTRTGAVTLLKSDIDTATAVSGTFNSGLGNFALSANTSGTRNSAIGYAAMAATTTGGGNSALGVDALGNNVGGNSNSAVGVGALRFVTSGSSNVGFGLSAGYATSGNVTTNANTTGSNNTYLGANAMPGTATQLNYASVLGSDALVSTSNTVVLGRTTDNTVLGATGDDASGNKLQVTGGVKATGALTVGGQVIASAGTVAAPGYVFAANLGTGFYLPAANQIGAALAGTRSMFVTANSLALGSGALNTASTGVDNIAIGRATLIANTTGTNNIAIGGDSLKAVTTNGFNVAVGASALTVNTSLSNTALGSNTLQTNTTGTSNVAVGRYALDQNTTGSSNTGIGLSAGTTTTNPTTSSNSVYVGAAASIADTAFMAGSGRITLLGAGTTASGLGAANANAYMTAIGSQASVTTANTVVLGRTTDNTVLGATADDASGNKLQVSGGIKATTNITAGGALTVTGTGVSTFSGAITTTGTRTMAALPVTAQGLWTGWNRAGNGISYIINQKGAGTGGISFGESTAADVYTQGMILNGTTLTVGATNYTSDRRLKDNIVSLDRATTLEKLKSIGTYSYNFKQEPDRRHVGVMAQDLLGLFPDLVKTNSETGFYAVDYAALGALSASAVGELATKVDNLGLPANGNKAVNGALLIGNGNGYTSSTLTAGKGIAIVNEAGSITIKNTGVTGFNGRTGDVTLNLADLNGVSNVGNGNFTLGNGALAAGAAGSFNTATGQGALASTDGGSQNTAQGYQALFGNTASGNTAQGYQALFGNLVGADNVGLGRQAGYADRNGVSANANVGGSNNTFLGAYAMPGTTAQLNYATAIGSDAVVTTSNTLVLGRSTDVTVLGATGDDGSGERLQVTGNIKATGSLLAKSLALTAGTKNGLWIDNGATASIGNGLVRKGDSTLLFAQGTINGPAGLVIGPWASGAAGMRVDGNGVAVAGALNVSGTISGNSAFAMASDARFKKDVAPIADALGVINQLQGVRYTFDQANFPSKNFEAGRQLGFIAQQIESILPEVVRTDAEGYKSVQYSQLTPLLVEGMKAQQTILKHMSLKDPATLLVDIKTFQANDAVFENIKATNIKVAVLEAETARIKKLEADSIESKSVRSDVVKSGELEVFVSMGTFQPMFTPQAGSQYIVNATAEDGSSAFASVAFMAGGTIKVTPISGTGVDVTAMGAQVGLVASSKKIKATWIRMS